MPIFRYPFFYNNYGNYYNRPIPYGSNNNLHINNNEYRPENFESKPQENPNKPLEEKKLNDDNKKNNSKKQAGECNFSVTHPSLLQSNARDQFPKRYSAPKRQALQVGASYYAE